MPRTKKDEDLFNQSSMSFLEHLDELRVCMIGAILCVVGGLLISVIPLGFAPSMATTAVDYVQRPLKKSLENYHILQSQKQLEKKRQELLELGYSEEVASLPSKLRMTAKTFYIFPQDLETRFRRRGDDDFFAPGIRSETAREIGRSRQLRAL